MKLQNILHPSRSWRVRRFTEQFRAKPNGSANTPGTLQSQQLSPTLLAAEEIVQVLKTQYGLSVDGLPKRMSGGIESAAWSVSSDCGEWVVKAFQPRRVAVDIVNAEVRLYQYLNDRGFHTPVARPTLAGKSVGILSSHKCEFPVLVMRLEQLRKCTSSDITEPELKQIARTAARIHEELQNYSRDELFDLLSQPLATQAYARFAASPLAEELTRSELAEFQATTQKMVAYARQHPTHPALSKSLLHGDFTLEHVQFLPDGGVYLFDFADRSWGPIIYGLAVPLAHFYTADDISFDRWEELKAWFLEGYTSAHRLTPEDQAALTPALIVRLLNEIAYLSDKASLHPEGIRSIDVQKRFDLAAYLLRDFDDSLKARTWKSVHQWVISGVGWLSGVFSLLDS